MDSDWQMEQLSNKDRNEYMFTTGVFSDCTIWVGENDDEPRMFYVHKNILASASPVFERMFFGSIPFKPDELVNITDIQPDVFYILLKYIYCDVFDVTTMDTAYGLYFASKKYMLKQLNQHCLKFIGSKLDAQNVLQALEFAIEMEETNLHVMCVEVIKAKTSDILKSSNLNFCKVVSLRTIFNQNQLNITNELELFEALEKYAKSQKLYYDNATAKNVLRSGSTGKNMELKEQGEGSKQKETDAMPKTQSEKPDNNDCDLIAALPDKKEKGESKFENLIKRIRFLTMTAKEFLSGPAFSQLLTPADSLAILDCIIEPENINKRLPVGFTTSIKSRFTKDNRTQIYYNNYSPKGSTSDSIQTKTKKGTYVCCIEIGQVCDDCGAYLYCANCTE